MKNVLEMAAHSYRRKKALIREHLSLPFALLNIWWESPADAAETLRYIRLFPSPKKPTVPMQRIHEALRRRASSEY